MRRHTIFAWAAIAGWAIIMLIAVPLSMYNYLAEADIGLEHHGTQNEPSYSYTSINEESLTKFATVKNMLDYYQHLLSQNRFADPTQYGIGIACPPHQGCYPVSSIRLYLLSSFIETFDLVQNPDYPSSFSQGIEHEGKYYRLYLILPRHTIIDYLWQGFILTVAGTVAISLIWAFYDRKKN